jgi:hypothetical protein
MAYVAPTVRTTGDLITASVWNQDIVNDILAIQGGLAGTGFALIDVLGSSSDPAVSGAGLIRLAANTTTGSLRASISGAPFSDVGGADYCQSQVFGG